MDQLGIQPVLLLTQIVNFLIILFVLTKFLYKPILKVLDERKSKIAEGLKLTEEQEQKEAVSQEKRAKILKEAHDESRAILAQAKKDGQALKDEAVAKGKQELETLRVRLEKDMETRLAKSEKELTAQTVDVAAEMVRSILGDVLTSADQHKLIKNQLKRIEINHEKQKKN
ncbi:ATP synthase F0 subunit B [Candidatus Microgenomates bacterium]|nr:MAG: ATP synthase F0 subunit B [Candidatus Microgenomates bacterium]